MASRKEQRERLRAQRLQGQAENEADRRRRRLVQYGSGAAFLAVCVVVALTILSQSGAGSAGSGTKDAGLIARQLNGLSQHGTSLGDPKKVTVVEYGDLQCPVCKAFSLDVAPNLVSDVVRKGAADYEFRQFTIIGPDSVLAAKAALAAGEQGRYWNFVELFFRNQGAENSGYVTNRFLEAVARGAGRSGHREVERGSEELQVGLGAIQGPAPGPVARPGRHSLDRRRGSARHARRGVGGAAAGPDRERDQGRPVSAAPRPR